MFRPVARPLCLYWIWRFLPTPCSCRLARNDFNRNRNKCRFLVDPTRPLQDYKCHLDAQCIVVNLVVVSPLRCEPFLAPKTWKETNKLTVKLVMAATESMKMALVHFPPRHNQRIVHRLRLVVVNPVNHSIQAQVQSRLEAIIILQR